MKRKKNIGVLLAAVVIFQVFIAFGNTMTVKAEENTPEELQNLYAQSAVLMDAGSGRVLFEKNGYEKRAMASTTKIMTCILALEQADLRMEVEVSEKAARQPKVHLGMQKGEKFYLEDLLYSLMLESHNDSAVAIAEGVAGSVEAFTAKMDEKARELGCMNSHFVTPNGLDAEDSKGRHATTAEELALIMRYCIMESPKREEFLTITQTSTRSFKDVDGKRTFSCNNHNAFLNMMDGALSGKTGFTSDAGYCYVGALRRDKRTFIVALLGCGWPSHKTYKWRDTCSLMNYALGKYRCRSLDVESTVQEIQAKTVEVPDGQKAGQQLFGTADLKLDVMEWEPVEVLLRDDEKIETVIKLDQIQEAPIRKGQVIGTLTYRLHGRDIRIINITAAENIYLKDYRWTLQKLLEWYFLHTNVRED